ncbi:hypothetical protein [Oceanicaulis sp. MMSF_3324]|uniref:hypothetical protein n=1 Tax=Oceanicaulis sp. MMSF_3324 TaxID=3046702 RepID=UPI00273DBDA4|nr:hypothetical protein [Oceanicaulis sp. MMSF_3324]
MSFPALAQDAATDSDTLNRLLACRALSDEGARLACQDEHLAALAQATESGRVVVVERQALREVERESFGLNLSSVGRLGSFLRRSDSAEARAAAETETFSDGSVATYDETGQIESLSGLAVQSVDRVRNKLRVTLVNGQVWAQTDSTPLPGVSRRAIRDGLTVEIENGALGSHFMRLSSSPSRRFRAERIR